MLFRLLYIDAGGTGNKRFGGTIRVKNLKFATYLKFATCENTNKINELWRDLLTV